MSIKYYIRVIITRNKYIHFIETLNKKKCISFQKSRHVYCINQTIKRVLIREYYG